MSTFVGDEDSTNPELCPCCGRYVHKETLSIGCNTTDLDFLGPGYPLFFSFIKYSAYFLIILILSAGSYNFFSNSVNPACIEPTDEEIASGKANHCPLTWVSKFSLANKRHD